MRFSVLATYILFATGCAMASSYKISDHYDGKKFFNNVPVQDKSLIDVMKWKATTTAKNWPESVENTAKPQLGPATKPSEVNATFINHATYLLQFEKTNVLVDPVFSERTSPLSFAGPKRVRRPGVEMDQLPQIHIVLVTHNHYDHMDLDSLEQIYKKFKPVFLVPIGNKTILDSRKIENITELDWWESYKTEELEVLLTPAQHWSARGIFDKFEALWGGFFLRTQKLKIFWAGDTGYGPHFKQIKEKLGAPDISFLPIGAFEPRWFMKDFHTNPADSVQAHQDLESKLSIGMHYGTFQLSDEGLEDPVIELEKAKKEKSIENFVVFKEGESRKLGAP